MELKQKVKLLEINFALFFDTEHFLYDLSNEKKKSFLKNSDSESQFY